MASPRDLILRLLITARNQASGVLDGLRTRIGQIGVAAASAARGGIAVLGAALAVGIKSGLGNAAEFETILLRIKVAGVGSQAELNRLADAARRLGAESGAGPAQIALALENLVKAGLSADEALAALPNVINLAQGQMLGLAEASDLVVKTVNQFGLRFSDSQRVVDLFATAANVAATSVQDLRQGLENSALAARSNGLSLQQTLAALNTLIQNGQPAAEAGEALQNMLLELGDASSQAREQLRVAGVVTGDFTAVLDLLAQGGPQASAVLGAFSETAQTAAGILSNSQPFYREQVRQLTAIGVSAADAAKIMGGSFEDSLSQLQATFSEFWQTLAEPVLPALTELFKTSTRVINENRQALSDWITTGLSPLTGTIDLVRYGWAQYNGEAEKAAQINQAMNERLAAIGRALSGTSDDYRKAATQAQDLATAQQRVTGAVADQATALTAIQDAIATYNQELAKAQPVIQQAHQAQQAAKQTLEELGVAYRIAEAQAARLREQVAAGQATTQAEAAARSAAARALGDYASAAQGVVAAAQRQIDLTAAETETLNQNQTAHRAQQEAILQLAQARGDQNAAAQASADLARLEVQSAQEIADAKTRQVTQAAQLLTAKRQEYEFTIRHNGAQQQEIALLEQTVQQKLAEANAARGLIPLREEEAAQAERMAGPIGVLLRLTEQRIAATGRETAAIERGYDAQIREQQVIEAVANAKGDAATAAAAAVRIKELEAEKAQAVADALAREAEAAIAAAEAKKLEILASDRSIEAKSTEIAALDALIAKQRDSVAAAQATAAAARAQADAAADSAAAANDASAAIRETGDATERSGNQANGYSAALVYLADNFDRLSERGQAALEAIGKGPDFTVGAGIMSAWRYLELITQATQKLDEAAGAEIAFNRRLQETAALANGMGEEADRAREQLVRMAQTGSIGIQGLTQDGEQAIQMLEDIRNASLEAEAALSGMAEDFERQILQLRGDRRALLEREHQDNLRRIEEEYAKAGALGRDEYAAAKRRAEDLHKLKLRQLEEQDRQSRTRPPTGGETASAGGTGAGGGAMTINNTFLIDPTKLTSEEWVRRNVLPTVDKVSRLRG